MREQLGKKRPSEAIARELTRVKPLGRSNHDRRFNGSLLQYVTSRQFCKVRKFILEYIDTSLVTWRNCKQIRLPRGLLSRILPDGYIGPIFSTTQSADAVTILVSLSGTVGECRWVSQGGFVRG
ncbi:uncharacterized protein [Anoplolepis gracilipes]|uniref:uncharacterized protein n=1 Tax=Anoplolepis gracilipes TaxID=354296 RepID=UPI003BA1EFA2